MKRRSFLRGLAAIPVASSTGWAHTPYGQWVTYRRKHLLIGCNKLDPATYELAKILMAELAHSLPDASARIARAPRPQRIASLMGTDQLDIAILAEAEAMQMMRGDGIFKPYGPIPIGLLARFEGEKLLIAHEKFKAGHAWLVAAAAHETSVVAKAASSQDMPIDWHAGAKEWQQGNPMPGDPE